MDKLTPFTAIKAGPRGGTYTPRELLKLYDSIVSGKASTVKIDKLSPESKKAFNSYEKVRGGRVLVPHSAGEKVSVSRSGNVSVKYPSGVEKVYIPCEFHNLVQYLNCVKHNRAAINRQLKGKNWAFGFEYKGTRSVFMFKNIEQLIEHLEYGRSGGTFEKALTGGKYDQVEAFHHLVIVQSTPTKWEKLRGEDSERGRRKRGAESAGARKRRQDREPQYKADLRRKKDAERQRKHRASLSKTEKEKIAKKDKNRKKRGRK